MTPQAVSEKPKTVQNKQLNNNVQEKSQEAVTEPVPEVPAPEPVQVQVQAPIAPPAPAQPVGDHAALMAAAGIDPADYYAVEYIISHESGWCSTKWNGQIGYCPAEYTATNPTGGSSAYGMCQSLPGSKMSSAGADWQTNPVTQLKWCASYAVSRYGSWGGAYSHWQAYQNW